MIQEGGSTNTIENPEKLVRKKHRLDAWGVVLIIIAVVCFLVLMISFVSTAGFNDRKFSPEIVAPWKIAGLSALAACVVAGVFAAVCSIVSTDLEYRYGARLVKAWLKMKWTSIADIPTFDNFPQNWKELESYADFLQREISFLATRFTRCIDQREMAEAYLNKVKEEKPIAPDLPKGLTPREIGNAREGLNKTAQAALHEHSVRLRKAEETLTPRISNAHEASWNYNDLWNLVKNLGEFYGVNVLPVNPATGKSFESPDKFRKSLPKREPLPDLTK